jgi:O-antigen/teichoic acid export membrane protein
VVRSFLDRVRLLGSESSLRYRALRGVSWNLVGTLVGSGCNFLLTIIVARLLGREGLGRYSIIINTIFTASGIAQLATGYTAIRYVSEFRASAKERAGRIIALCSVITGVTASIAASVLFFGAGWISESALHAPALKPLVMIASIACYFATVNGYQIGTLAGLEEYGLSVAALGFGSATTLSATAAGAATLGLSGAVLGFACGSAIQWIGFMVAMRKACALHGIPVSYQGFVREDRVLWRFAIPASLPVLLLPVTWAASALLARQPGGFSELATYNAAFSLRGLVLFMPLALNRVSMSLLNHEKGQKRIVQYRKIFWLNLIATASLVTAGILSVGLIGPRLMLLFGKSFAGTSVILIPVFLAAALDGIGQAVYQLVQTRERMWLSFWTIVLPRDGVMFLLAFWLIPQYGAMGLATAVAVGSTIALVATTVVAMVPHRHRSSANGGLSPDQTIVAGFQGM